MKKLLNKVAGITGGLGGIGLATARLFPDKGAQGHDGQSFRRDVKGSCNRT